MLGLISSALPGIIIGIAAGALVVFTIVFNVIRKKKGKSSCGCDCSPKNKDGACGGCCLGCTGCDITSKSKNVNKDSDNQ